MDYQSFKQAVIAQAQAMGIAEYELYYTNGSSTSVSVFAGEVSGFSSGEEGGVCFRCIVDGRMGYSSTQSLTESEAAAIVKQAAENATSLETDEQVFLCEGGKEYEKLELNPYELPSTEELISTAMGAVDKLCAAHPAIVPQCKAQGISERSEIAICNSKGLDLHYENTCAGLVLVAVASDGKEMANDFQVKLGELSALDVDGLAQKAAEGAVRKLGGDVPPTGQYPVVFAPDAMSDLLQTFCGVFSSENAQKGLSRLGDQEGKAIASPCVTLVDDPFYPENPMPIPFDAEGCPTRKKNVIEGGVLSTLLYNMKTAAVAGKETTGNASKGGYDGAVMVRPFTMYVAPGSMTEDEVLAKARDGVYITSLGGLHAGANPISGDFSLQSAGFLIRDGKKTDYVKSFTVAGNFYDLLKNITAVSDKVVLPMAMGMTAFGSPSVLVEGLSVAGK